MRIRVLVAAIFTTISLGFGSNSLPVFAQSSSNSQPAPGPPIETPDSVPTEPFTGRGPATPPIEGPETDRDTTSSPPPPSPPSSEDEE